MNSCSVDDHGSAQSDPLAFPAGACSVPGAACCGRAATSGMAGRAAAETACEAALGGAGRGDTCTSYRHRQEAEGALPHGQEVLPV